MVAVANLILLLQGTVAIMFFSLAFASDPSPLQDFCVTHPNAPVAVNGWPCKDPKQVLAEDFFFSGLNLVGNTSNPYGSKVTLVNVDLLPGLNTLGVSLARVDYLPRGLNPLHLHPRATEVFTVLEGTLEVGFVTSNPDYRFIGKVLHKGDVFVFPQGLIHYQRNVGYGNAVAVSALSSQNPGIVRVAESVFGSSPHVSPDILSKSFQVYKQVIERIQSKF